MTDEELEGIREGLLEDAWVEDAQFYYYKAVSLLDEVDRLRAQVKRLQSFALEYAVEEVADGK